MSASVSKTFKRPVFESETPAVEEMLDRVMTYTHREQFSFLIRLESGECLGLEIDPCRLYRWLSSCPGRLVNVQEIDNCIDV